MKVRSVEKLTAVSDKSEREVRQPERLSIGCFPRLEKQIVNRVIRELVEKMVLVSDSDLRFRMGKECGKDNDSKPKLAASSYDPRKT